MRFSNLDDKKLFLMEIDRLDLLNKISEKYEPSEDLLELFIMRRRKTVPKLKDYKKSRMTAAQWRKDKFKMMGGIKDFHTSTKGKKMHRAIGRFLATRDFRGGVFAKEAYQIPEISDLLKGLTSSKTFGYVGLEFYRPLSEQIDYEIFLEELVHSIDRIEQGLIHGKQVSGEDLDFLIRITEEKTLIDEVSEHINQSFAMVECFWGAWKSLLDMDEVGNYLTLLNDSKCLHESVDPSPLWSTVAQSSGNSTSTVKRAWHKIKEGLSETEVKLSDSNYYESLVSGLKQELKLN